MFSNFSGPSSCQLTSLDNYSSAERYKCDGLNLTSDGSGDPKKPEDRMTELISLQKSSGMFEISSNDWQNSVFEYYAGEYVAVQDSCPPGITIILWTTAIAINILEIKMSDQKELWELVARKSKNCLNVELKKDKQQLQNLLDKAKEYIKRT